MNGKQHKIVGFIIFLIFYYFELFPNSINLFLKDFFNLFIALFIVFLFSGGRFNSKNFWYFGLSPDNDFHKKMKRDWLFHSSIFPTILLLLLNNSITKLIGFFYSLHTFIDLFNINSFKGTRFTYMSIFLSIILFYLILYII